jgi:hypothetical protein
MACTGCAARRARAIKWTQEAIERAKSLIRPAPPNQPEGKTNGSQTL